MKTVELFCASPASTAICTTTNHRAMVRRSGGSTPQPLNHRHHHHNYKFKSPPIPCTTSQQHIDPKPFTTYLQKNRKSTSSAASLTAKNWRFSVENLEDSDDVFSGGGMVVSGGRAWPDDDVDDLRVVRKCLSSRLSRGDDSPAVVKTGSSSLRLHATAESPGSKSVTSGSRNQVVELRVSIHCKGCEGKVKKHISRMEGVKSFHIDLESKKVTVIGDITPLSVLASISKVKNAQLWPSSPSSSSSPFIAIGF
ncbi:hypothetical protein SSX86_019797 [Deinandra increscens subsp. villosa]|uniref:HMA domain-containing protein n=1 Tax=Deinandra increscens subsp. villosa TaxID=3103831 RepID=A0AAP0GVX2_9ASTR